MTGTELRESFLKFFESKGHLILPSGSLVPEDPTTLLTSAGMQPFVPYFMGQEEPPCRRVTTCQKACRADDIEEVGHTSRHCTFFEMLGNFSFGDYFKQGAIEWAWEYVTEVLALPREVLWFSVYLDDDEAHDLWQNRIGVAPDRIFRFGKKDNWWGPVGKTGPCGPDSEIFLDRGPEYGCGKPDCRPGCDCDRFGELWNLVFQQFDQQEGGELIALPSPGIDTGMGFERVAAVLQGKQTIFEGDVFWPLLQRLEAVAKETGASFGGYGSAPETDIAMRIIADHLRAVVFMMTDGIRPSNEGRGYVQRRFLRRAALRGRLLGIEEPFLSKLIPTVIDVMGDAYPELATNRQTTEQYVQLEEERFQETLEQGLALLEDVLAGLQKKGETRIPGAQVFRLYDTFGFPAELTAEVAAERNFSADLDGFAAELEAQRERARAGSSFAQGWQTGDVHARERSEFVGYETCRADGTVLAVYDSESGSGVVLDRTPFYAECGGQVGDTGVFNHAGGEVAVLSTTKSHEAIVHWVENAAGLTLGTAVQACVDESRRNAIRRAHSATHLLQAALRTVVGEHVAQAGSAVDADRFRFDFSHFKATAQEELAAVEQCVNEQIAAQLPVTARETTLSEAKAAGAMALFGEKYGQTVRLVEMGTISKELCGGTHVAQTGDIGVCKLLRESSVGSNLRRIEALTGPAAIAHLNEREAILKQVAGALGTQPERVPQVIDKLQADLKSAQQEVQALVKRSAQDQGQALAADAVEVGGIQVLVTRMDEVRAESLRAATEQLAGPADPSVAVIGGVTGGKVLFAAKASKGALAKGAHMGNLLRQVAAIAGGGGGGRPDFAQAGGKDASKVAEALGQVASLVQGQIE